MLRSFDSIKNCGIFQDFKWDPSTPNFEHINLIYGANGTGKTSLSRMLDDLAAAGPIVNQVSINMSEEGGQHSRSSAGIYDTEFSRIHVFSDGYVKRSHNFEDGAEIEAVLTLGERTIDEEKKIDDLKAKIEINAKKVEEAIAENRREEQVLDNEYTNLSRIIVTALSRSGGSYASRSNYSKSSVKRRFEKPQSDWILLTDEEKNTALSTVNSDKRMQIPSRVHSYSPRAGLIGDITSALTLSPASVALDTLQGHEEAAPWVDKGRSLHEGLSQCIFCGGSLTRDRRMEIENHFSDSVEKAHQTLDSLIAELEDIKLTVNTLLGEDTVIGLLFEDLRDSFRAHYDAAVLEAEQLDDWLTIASKYLEEKRSNVTIQIQYQLNTPPTVNGSPLERIITEHNTRVVDHSKLIRESATKVEHHLLAEAKPRIDAMISRCFQTSKVKSTLEKELKDLRSELFSLENAASDPLPSAEVMARELARILGRNELSFELLSDGKHYQVTRGQQPARELSTGERTAITLIHFLESVKRSSTENGKPIVIIDDPVSSLDSGSSMGISTYIWSEAVTKKHIEQVILLTHNFELFRQWDLQIDHLPKGREYTSCRLELTSKHQIIDQNLSRTPVFTTWPPKNETRAKVRSTYHHAFFMTARAYMALIAEPTLDSKLDAQLLYPNVLRRMLETFLAFKDPKCVGNFTSAMRDFGKKLEINGYEGDADALRLHLTRFMHTNSHSESPETDLTVSPDEIGTIISAVFTFMRILDPNHFNGLCEVTGFDASSLILSSSKVATPERPAV